MSTHDAAVLKRIRVRKEDSAYVYAILEAHEGICSYSTLDCPPGTPYRDLELQIPVAYLEDVERVIQALGSAVYEPEEG